MGGYNKPSTTTSPGGGYDVERVRRDFPILQRAVHGKPLVYLDNAATAQKPRAVIDALSSYYENINSNVHRGVHTLSVKATQAYEEVREKTRIFIGARDSREVIFVRGTTEGVNLVAHAFGDTVVCEGDEIVLSEMEHHSNIVPWQLLCERSGAKLRVIPMNDRGELELDRYRELLGPKTRLVAIVHVSNSLGTINPVGDMIRIAHERGIPVLVDGAQAVPHMPVDVRELDCDFYVFSSHKAYGPMGAGVVYAKAELLEKMVPYQSGGDMIRSVTFDKTTYNTLPYRFEAGTPNVADVVAFGTAIDYLLGIGYEGILAHEHDLLDYATALLEAEPGIQLIGTASAKAAVISFIMDGIHPHDVGTIVDREGIAIRTGHHCTQPVMDHFRVPATSRASFGIYSTRAEVDALIEALHKVRKVFD